jgi:hypothetical protein
MVSRGHIDITQLVNEARALANNGRTVQAVAVLAAVAALLTVARLRDMLPTLGILEVPAFLLVPCVLFLALLLASRLNLSLNVPLAELAELPAFRKTRTQAESLLQRVDLFVHTMAVQACVLIDSFVWNKIAVAEPTGLLAAHTQRITLLFALWRSSWRLPRVIETLEAHLRSLIDGRSLRELLERLASWIVLPGQCAGPGELRTLAPDPTPERAALHQPLSINLLC